MSARPALRFLLDEGVPDSVGRVLARHGHEVIYGNRVLVRGSIDQLVCATAVLNGAILVAIDGDMKEIAKKHGVTGGKYHSMSLLKLSCFEPQAAARVEAAHSIILHEWKYSDGSTGRRLYVDVADQVIRIYR